MGQDGTGRGGFLPTSFPRAAPTSWNSLHYAASVAQRSGLGSPVTVNINKLVPSSITMDILLFFSKKKTDE